MRRRDQKANQASEVAKDPRQPEATQPKSQIGKTLHRLLSYALKDKGRLTLALLLILVSVLFSAFLPVLMGQAINIIGAETGQTGQAGMNDLTRIVLLIIGFALGLWITNWIGNRLVQNVAQDALLRLRTELFDHIQTLSLNFYDRRPIGELMSSLTNDIDTIDSFFSRSLAQMISAVLTIVITIVVMVFLNLPLTIVTLVAIPVMLGVAVLLGRIAGPAFEQLQAKLGDTNGYMEETLAGDKTVIAYSQQNNTGDRLEELSMQARDVGAKAQFAALTVSPMVSVVQNSQSALVALVGSILAIQGYIPFGTVVAFMTYSAQLQSPIMQLGQLYNALLQAAAGAARVFAIMDEEPTVQDRPAAKPFDFQGGHVVFDHVDFSYVPGRKILRDNTFEALPGQKIGLCGPTGAGKSTIINILTRYYDIDSGEITIDGQNIADLTQESLRKSISAVLQEPFLFSDTVMNNLKYAREGATDEECIAAAKEANAHDFIMQLADGYNTVLTERGANLSQGQRQMLTIARAMVAQPKMLILDEATSNVDTRTEKLIQEGLSKLMQGRTSFVIAHRLSTIRDSAQILVINAGAIVEQGTHDELMARRGFYYDLYMTQFRARPEAA